MSVTYRRVGRHRAGWRRPSLGVLTVAAGAVATMLMGLSMNTSMAAFTASVAHTNDKSNTGTLTMQETNPDTAVTCFSTDGAGNGVNTNAATCTGINHYGTATVAPGQTSTATLTIKNTGSVTATGFTLTYGACTQTANAAAGNVAGSATDLCNVIYTGVHYTLGGTTTYLTQTSITLNAAATAGTYTLAAVPAGATATFYFGVGLSGGVGNTYQGLTATQSLTFQFTS